MFEIEKGKMFAGSMVHKSGRWSNCPKCNKRIAVGVSCTCGKRISHRPEHKDVEKPEIKGE